FFFQAEDGIRDYKVTGVQTCALPISLSTRFNARRTADRWATACPDTSPDRRSTRHSQRDRRDPWEARVAAHRRQPRVDTGVRERSEERRVGKECRGGSGRARDRE